MGHQECRSCYWVCNPKKQTIPILLQCVSRKSDTNYLLFRCLLTACFDNIPHIEEQQMYIYSCLPVLIFQDGSYFKSIFVEHYQNLQFSLQLLSIKVQCQLSVVMQTPVSLYKLCSGTNKRLSNNTMHRHKWQRNQCKKCVLSDFTLTMLSLCHSRLSFYSKSAKIVQAKHVQDDSINLAFNLLKTSKAAKPLK